MDDEGSALAIDELKLRKSVTKVDHLMPGTYRINRLHYGHAVIMSGERACISYVRWEEINRSCGHLTKIAIPRLEFKDHRRVHQMS